MQPPSANPESAFRIQSEPPAPSSDSTQARLAPGAAAQVQRSQFLQWVVTSWILGALAFWMRLVGGCLLVMRMQSVQVRDAPPEWQQTLKELGTRIGLSRPVRLLVSALVQVPTVIGWPRPVVLIPVGSVGGMPAAQLQALLLHELTHIRRHDYLVNVLQMMAEALLFYHPAVWWVSGHMRAERELCCDDVAVLVSGDALTYARALAQLESYRSAYFNTAMAANKGSLPHRIARVLGQSRPAARSGFGPGVVAIATLLAVGVCAVLAQSDEYPKFESASIRPNTTDWSKRMQHPMGVSYRPGGRLVAQNASVKLLVQFAYAPHGSAHWLPLLGSQVVGGPDWIDASGYDIEAKPQGDTDPAHTWRMLQALLADRFQLALHREKRELPVYELSSGAGGPSVPAAKPVECGIFPPGTPPRHVAGKVDCGYVPLLRTGSGFRLEGSRVHMGDLVRALSTVLDRPVLDETGFGREFDLDLSFDGDKGDAGHLNLETALKKQLGLRLAPAKGAVDVLVIDRVQKPAGI